ncbi:hypothetical protein VTI74DRAFT_4399 [Chaetomium olivicolor]
MTELTPVEAAASARAEEQARLRKARREAKIKAGAESRLKTITGLGGGIQRDPAPAPVAAPAPSTTSASPPASTTPAAGQPQAQQHADPEEVDISQHFYQPRTTPRIPQSTTTNNNSAGTTNLSDSQLRQMMLGLDAPTPSSGRSSGAGTPSLPPGMEDDPMMKMMMQLLGGNAASGSNPFAASHTQQQQQHQQQQQPPLLPNRYASLWRLLHTLVALALGLYIALCTPFTGTKLSRDRAAAVAAGHLPVTDDENASPNEPSVGQGHGSEAAKNFFWAFATAEALLLTTRYFMDRGRSRLGGLAAGGNGVLGMVAGLLPAGVRGKVEVAMRYGEVLGTVRGDVLVCVFVLGVASWARG